MYNDRCEDMVEPFYEPSIGAGSRLHCLFVYFIHRHVSESIEARHVEEWWVGRVGTCGTDGVDLGAEEIGKLRCCV